MTASIDSAPGSAGSATRRNGYLVAIVVNLLLLIIANEVPGWNIRFLTAEFAELLWLIDLCLLAAVAFNAVYLWYDPAWFRSLGQIALNSIGIALTIRLYQVFPFDFSIYEADWARIARIVMVVALAASAVGIIVEIIKLARSLVTTPPSRPIHDRDQNVRAQRH